MQGKRMNDLYESRGLTKTSKLKEALSQVLNLISNLKKRMYNEMKKKELREKNGGVDNKNTVYNISIDTDRKITIDAGRLLQKDLPGYRTI